MELIAVYALVVIVAAGLAALGLVLWAACKVSGDISREEERRG